MRTGFAGFRAFAFGRLVLATRFRTARAFAGTRLIGRLLWRALSVASLARLAAFAALVRPDFAAPARFFDAAARAVALALGAGRLGRAERVAVFLAAMDPSPYCWLTPTF